MVLYANCEDYRDDLNFPTMVIVGSRDELDAFSCKTTRERGRSPELKIHIIEDAYHAFDNSLITRLKYDVGNRPMLYSGAATAQSKQLVDAFLAKLK